MPNIPDTALVSLNEGNFDVADGEPDVRGWRVVTYEDTEIGRVEDLLANPQVMKVEYLVIDLDKDVTPDTSERRVRVPVGRARVDEHDKRVLLDRDVEAARDGAVEAARGATATTDRDRVSDDTVRMTRAAEELRIGKREVQAGEVELRKRVETEHVRQPVTLRHEEVQVERRPVANEYPGRDVQITDQEIRVPVTEEEVVVEKRPVVKEEVVITKRQGTTEQTVEEDVREEHIDVERHERGDSRDPSRGRTR